MIDQVIVRNDDEWADRISGDWMEQCCFYFRSHEEDDVKNTEEEEEPTEKSGEDREDTDTNKKVGSDSGNDDTTDECNDQRIINDGDVVGISLEGSTEVDDSINIIGLTSTVNCIDDKYDNAKIEDEYHEEEEEEEEEEKEEDKLIIIETEGFELSYGIDQFNDSDFEGENGDENEDEDDDKDVSV